MISHEPLTVVVVDGLQGLVAVQTCVWVQSPHHKFLAKGLKKMGLFKAKYVE